MTPHRGVLVQTGEVLRLLRRARGLTLRDVGARSGGRFKPTAVAGYERAERSISLERFFELAGLYEVAPDRLLAEIVRRVQGRPPPTIDRDRIGEIRPREGEAVGSFVEQVLRLRGGVEEETITVRVRDLEVLATASGERLEEFLEYLRPALVSPTDEANQGSGPGPQIPLR